MFRSRLSQPLPLHFRELGPVHGANVGQTRHDPGFHGFGCLKTRYHIEAGIVECLQRFGDYPIRAASLQDIGNLG